MLATADDTTGTWLASKDGRTPGHGHTGPLVTSTVIKRKRRGGGGGGGGAGEPEPDTDGSEVSSDRDFEM